MTKYRNASGSVRHGAPTRVLRTGESATYCVSCDDPSAGMKECLSKNGLRCAEGALTKAAVAQGRGLEARDRDGRKYLVAYRGNRDFEVFRMPDDEVTLAAAVNGKGEERAAAVSSKIVPMRAGAAREGGSARRRPRRARGGGKAAPTGNGRGVRAAANRA